jgi:hypothetical protein
MSAPTNHHDYYYYPELSREETMPNYPESTGPNDPSAPWNQEGWTKEQEELVDKLKQTLQAIDDLEQEYLQRNDVLYNQVTELREQVWNTGLDPDDALELS